jgi:GNAT superfamily N-acetyltransferase
VIGVEPEWCGKGFGAALMQPILERCDRERLPAHLEATTPRNRALYERLGFEVVEEITVKDSPPAWPMWREPQA